MTGNDTVIEEILTSLFSLKKHIYAKTEEMLTGTLTQSQYMVLYLINKHENITVKKLAEIVGVTSSGVTQLVDALEKAHLVTKKQDKEDKRAIHIFLSEKGVQTLKEAKKHHITVAKELFSTLSKEELTTLLSLHKKVLQTLQ